jgi:hypothetical protein
MERKKSMTNYEAKRNTDNKVYLVQEIPTDRDTGQPKIDITPALKYGEIKILFPRLKQMQFTPGPMVMEIKNSLKDFTTEDYLLLYGDPAIIGVVCAVASEITNGKFKLLKYDRRQFSYYPIELNIFQN